MQFPFKPQHIVHRHGGKIVEIKSMTHQVNKPSGGYSMDGWWFVGDVEWSDGTKSVNHPIDPPMLCIDGDNDAGRQEVSALREAMMGYLRDNGEWREAKPQGWYANNRKNRRTA